MSQSERDQDAAAAVIGHHTQLASELAHHATRLRDAAAGHGSESDWQRYQAELQGWLHSELLPHAEAEEGALYPAAAAQPGAKLLIDGMLAEHRAITTLVSELADAETAVEAAAAARALEAVFEAHVAKENELILPLLLGADQVSLADLLAGMHDLLGESEADGCGFGVCGCGGDQVRADARSPVLTLDARLDVRSLPHSQRHERVLAELAALPADGALVMIAPHAPLPLLSEIETRFPGQIQAEWLQQGPEVWQIRLQRQPFKV